MTPGQFFAYCDLAGRRYRAERASMLTQMVTAFRANERYIEKSLKRLIADEE